MKLYSLMFTALAAVGASAGSAYAWQPSAPVVNSTPPSDACVADPSTRQIVKLDFTSSQDDGQRTLGYLSVDCATIQKTNLNPPTISDEPDYLFTYLLDQGAKLADVVANQTGLLIPGLQIFYPDGKLAEIVHWQNGEAYQPDAHIPCLVMFNQAGQATYATESGPSGKACGHILTPQELDGLNKSLMTRPSFLDGPLDNSVMLPSAPAP